MKEEKSLRNFEDLPPEWQDVQTLRSGRKITASCAFTGAFTAAAMAGKREITVAEYQVNPTVENYHDLQIDGVLTILPAFAAMALTYVCIRMGKFIRQGEAINNNRDNSPKP